MYYQIFVIAFVSIAIIYSLLASLTKIFYKNKPVSQLSYAEMQILDNKAAVGLRAAIFFTNLLGSLIFPPVWILAGVITLIAYLISLFF
jgi:hypothetical protein